MVASRVSQVTQPILNGSVQEPEYDDFTLTSLAGRSISATCKSLSLVVLCLPGFDLGNLPCSCSSTSSSEAVFRAASLQASETTSSQTIPDISVQEERAGSPSLVELPNSRPTLQQLALTAIGSEITHCPAWRRQIAQHRSEFCTRPSLGNYPVAKLRALVWRMSTLVNYSSARLHPDSSHSGAAAIVLCRCQGWRHNAGPQVQSMATEGHAFITLATCYRGKIEGLMIRAGASDVKDCGYKLLTRFRTHTKPGR